MGTIFAQMSVKYRGKTAIYALNSCVKWFFLSESGQPVPLGSAGVEDRCDAFLRTRIDARALGHGMRQCEASVSDQAWKGEVESLLEE